MTKPKAAEFVVTCPDCGSEALRARKVGTPAELARWRAEWAKVAARWRQTCACGCRIELEAGSPADAAPVRARRWSSSLPATNKRKRRPHP